MMNQQKVQQETDDIAFRMLYADQERQMRELQNQDDDSHLYPIIKKFFDPHYETEEINHVEYRHAIENEEVLE